MYWGVKEMPDFYRSRGMWWTTLMYVPSSLVKSIHGGLSALYVKIMECFWGVEFNMERLGIRIPVGDGLNHIHMKFAFFISDEKAEKEALGVNGGIRSQILCLLP